MAERKGNRRRMAAVQKAIGLEARWHEWLLQYELFRQWPGGGANNSTNGWRNIKYFGNGRGGVAGLSAMAARESDDKISWPRRYGSARIQQ